jgi:hypothetical protein
MGGPHQDEMSKLYREPSIDASYHVSVHLTKWFQRRRFLEIDQSETRIACSSHVYYVMITLKFFFSETVLPNEPKLGRKRFWKVLCRKCAMKLINNCR